MPVTLSIKNVPDTVVERLRTRAKVNRRSLQGELLAMVERAAAEAAVRSISVEELHDWAKAQGFGGTGDSTEDIRRMRDERGDHIERVSGQANATDRRKARKGPRGRR